MLSFQRILNLFSFNSLLSRRKNFQRTFSNVLLDEMTGIPRRSSKNDMRTEIPKEQAKLYEQEMEDIAYAGKQEIIGPNGSIHRPLKKENGGDRIYHTTPPKGPELLTRITLHPNIDDHIIMPAVRAALGNRYLTKACYAEKKRR